MTEYELETDFHNILELMDTSSPASKTINNHKRLVNKLEYKWKMHKERLKSINGTIWGFSWLSLAIFTIMYLLTLTTYAPLFNQILNISSAIGIFLSAISIGVGNTVERIIENPQNFNSPFFKSSFSESKIFTAYNNAIKDYDNVIEPYAEQLKNPKTQLDILYHFKAQRKSMPVHCLERFDSIISSFERCLEAKCFNTGLTYLPMITDKIGEWKVEPIPTNPEDQPYFERLKIETQYSPTVNLNTLL